MTLIDYLSEERFPATTQAGLSAAQQMMIDSRNYDCVKEFLENGGSLSESRRAIWRELKEKMKGRTRELVKEAGKA
jgi:uncharacterized protein YecT (DUF1311 family)